MAKKIKIKIAREEAVQGGGSNDGSNNIYNSNNDNDNGTKDGNNDNGNDKKNLNHINENDDTIMAQG